MAATFHVSVILPDRVVFDGEISSLIVPARKGYLGVLAHHAPIIAQLKPGTITLRDPGDKITGFDLKANGFLEFSGNKATILLDSLELPA